MPRTPSSSPFRSVSDVPLSVPESIEEKKVDIPKSDEKKPTMRSGIEKQLYASKGDADKNVENSAHFKATRYQGNSVESDEAAPLTSSVPMLSTRSSSNNATLAASMALANPEWAQFEEQALQANGRFKMQKEMDFGVVCNWLFSSPTGVHSVAFEERKFSQADVITLANSLKDNTTLTTLDLSQNGIGAEGAKVLAEALKVNTTLTMLSLNNNLIGAEGVQVLAEALKHHTTLTTLNLRYTAIGIKGAQELADGLNWNATLVALDLVGNDIGAEGTRAIVEVLKHNTALTMLNLRRNRIGDEGAKVLADFLKHNTTLTELDLMSNEIGDEGAKALGESLKHNTSLTKLLLGFNRINTESRSGFVEALKFNTGLTAFSFGDSSFQDQIAIELKKNKLLSEAKDGGHHALGPINAQLDASTNPEVGFYPSDVMGQLVRQMLAMGMKQEVINLLNESKPSEGPSTF